MSSTTSSTLAETNLAPQTLHRVTRAEFRRLRRKGGIPGAVLCASILGLMGGIGTLLVVQNVAPITASAVVTIPIEFSAFLSALILSIATVFSVGRDCKGQLSIALTLTPDRTRLHLARAIAAALLAAVTVLATTAIVAVISSVVGTTAAAGWAAVGVVVSAIAGACLVLLAFGITMLVRRASGAILILIAVLIVLPLGFVAGAGALPETLGAVARTATQLTPTPLFTQAVGITAASGQGFERVVQGLLGLAAWGGGLTLLALITFRSSDAGE